MPGPRIWLEVLFLKGLNDRPDQIDRLIYLTEAIHPEKIQINTVVRPPVEETARPLDFKHLVRIREKLGPRAEIIARPGGKAGQKIWLEDQILNMISRRPCTVEDLSRLTGLPPDETVVLLQALIGQKKISCEVFNQREFYRRQEPEQDTGGY